MELNQKKLKDYALSIGSILGYTAIAVGIVMTVLILRTIFTEA